MMGRMKILFIPQNCIPFNAFTLSDRPLGGTETAVINLSKSLSNLGHQVFVCTLEENPPLSEPHYIPINALENLGPVDILISVRSWEPLLSSIQTKIRILWTGDSYDQPQNFGIGDRRLVQHIDYLCCVSQWHQETLTKASGFPIEKTIIFRNGINQKLFNKSTTKISKRLIYSSTPYRGLKYLPEIYKSLLKIHPDSSLHICSGYQVYAGAGEYPIEALIEYDQIISELKDLSGVKIIGNIKQDQLAEEFLQARILSYPNTFEETSCITVLEAQAAGCIPVTSKKGALPETVGNSGVCIPGSPGTPGYNTDFIKAIDDIFRSNERATSLEEACKLKSQKSDWDHIAHNFSGFLTNALETRHGTTRNSL